MNYNRCIQGFALLASVGLWSPLAIAEGHGAGAATSVSLDSQGVSHQSDSHGHAQSGEAPVHRLVELGIFGGLLFAPDTHSLRSGAGALDTGDELRSINPELGIRAGVFPWRYAGVEGELGFGFSDTEDDESVNIIMPRVHAVGQWPFDRVTPFAVVGIGSMTADTDALAEDQDLSLHFGLGAKLALQPDHRFVLRLDVRDTIALNQPDQIDGVHWPEVLLGLSVALGGDDPEPAPPMPVDSDGDGLTDDIDQCPTAAATTPTGCPPVDSDGDGVTDDVDQCPDQPGTLDNGCPDLDPDGDGFTGDADRCPGEAGVEPDGCPDLDPDRDDIPLPADQCPNDPETVNGYQDEDGCPDQLPEVLKEFTGVIEGINFDLGKASIRSGSTGLLDNAAAVLIEYPNLRLQITGHTDNTGTRERNLSLSLERAESVRNYLVGKGVDPARLEVAGAGPDQPIADNATDDGRQLNRRIEFHIVK